MPPSLEEELLAVAPPPEPPVVSQPTRTKIKNTAKTLHKMFMSFSLFDLFLLYKNNYGTGDRGIVRDVVASGEQSLNGMHLPFG